MTATILQFPAPSKAQEPNPTRTAELAFVLAIIDALPDQVRSKAIKTVKAIASLNPDCDASQEAGQIASKLSSKRGV